VKSYIARGELLKGGIERLLNGNLALTLTLPTFSLSLSKEGGSH